MNASTVGHKSSLILKPAMFLMCGRTLAFMATFFIPVVLARVFDQATFGTYKQLFLIHSTAFFIAQVGMASSLYYFVPQFTAHAGRYVANSLAFLALAGALGFGSLVAAAPYLAKWMSSPQLPAYLWWTGIYLALMMVSAPLEIVMIVRGRFRLAALSYALSDIARAVALVAPVLIFHRLEALLIGSVVVAAARVIATLWYFSTVFGRELRPDMTAFRAQVAYAVPFGAAVLVETFYSSVPQYAVSFLADPATFAVFAVGCLQIPLVDFAASPTSDVMMVKMQESRAMGHLEAVVEIWQDTFWKLALLFFPLVGLVIVEGHDIIVTLFTAKYAASVPLFRVWSGLILFVTLQVDGVLRVFAETRYILILNLMRLAIVGALIAPSMHYFHLLGPVIVILLAVITFKMAALGRIARLFQVGWKDLLPWSRIAVLCFAAAAASVSVMLLKTVVSMRSWPLLFSASSIYALVYCALVWRLDLISEGEKAALESWFRQRVLRRSEVALTSEGGSVQELCAESPASSL
jgi:O-antigen/teichoic acid export membrane protein